ncbi:MAG: transcriptional regulator NrdR [Firmicutes bacterium]|nr:transcriptional regulator NrdR [Bacillota bacterium]
MKCNFCGHLESKVIDSRDVAEGNSIKRRRECLGCGRRFTTYETVVLTDILVVKSSGVRQPFDSSKVRGGIIKACEKTTVSIDSINKVVLAIEKRIAALPEQEIQAKTIGQFVMEALEQLDQVAYIRFASVYKKFADINAFMELIKEHAGKK